MSNIESNTPPELRESVPIALARAREAVMTYFRPILADYGYTEQQWRVLRAAAEHGPIDTTNLADRAALLMPSLTRILQTLEQKGDIHRTRDQRDSRRVLITISDQCRALLINATPQITAAYREIEDAMGREKLEHLHDLLAELSRLRKD